MASTPGWTSNIYFLPNMFKYCFIDNVVQSLKGALKLCIQLLLERLAWTPWWLIIIFCQTFKYFIKEHLVSKSKASWHWFFHVQCAFQHWFYHRWSSVLIFDLLKTILKPIKNQYRGLPMVKSMLECTQKNQCQKAIDFEQNGLN